MTTAVPAIVIERVSKAFGETRAVEDLSLSIPSGAFFALLGPSGCGKTTLMRLIAGFEAPQSGSIHIDGHDMAGVPPERRPVNMMFQSYALFPHMSVAGNIAYGLRRAGLSRAKVAEEVDAMLRLVQLQGLGARKPDQLSGGQRQRVALARALARKPRILLLDEPMAALDRKLREETQFALKDIQRELGTTFLVVTHDQEEAMGLADTIALMRAGRIEQVGSPANLYARPASKFVAGFIGETNVVEGVVQSIEGGRITVSIADGSLSLHAARPVEAGRSVAIAIRPECLTLNDEVRSGSVLTGHVHDVSFRGALSLVRVRLGSGRLLRIALAARSAPEAGAPVAIDVAPDDMWLLDD